MAENKSPARAGAAPGAPSTVGSTANATGSAPLTRERILEAAEETLRRFGPAKTTVVDVARALGVSHGTVYRHFASKTELRDSVLEQWLERRVAPLAPIVEECVSDDDGQGIARGGGGRSPAADRLHRWLVALMESKREEARSDPDLFAAYAELSAQSREVILRHVDVLTGQLTQILSAGAAAGEFAVAEPAAAARAVFDATVRFHHPAHAAEWSRPDIDESFDGVWSLVLTGLSPR